MQSGLQWNYLETQQAEKAFKMLLLIYGNANLAATSLSWGQPPTLKWEFN